MFKQKQMLLTLFMAIWTLPLASSVWACGGLFCTTTPVFQQAERIIFMQNGNDTTSAIIQINYAGDPDQFSWILPVKSAINVQTDVSIPHDGVALFDQVNGLTEPRYIAPRIRKSNRECDKMLNRRVEMVEDMSVGSGVEVLSDGIVGNYDIAVIGADDPDALITWLNDNQYTVTPEMEPLITVYVEEGFNFLAMKLVAGSSSDEIVPLQMVYDGDTPMIPLRMTPVGAMANMQVLVWIFAKTQAVPLNYESLRVPDEAVIATFFAQGSSSQGGHSYSNVVNRMVDEFDGRAFVTEYARETKDIELDMLHHSLLPSFMDDYDYLTRLNTFIDPDQMTIDPIFGYDASLEPLDRIHDFTDTHTWLCHGDTFDAELVTIGEFQRTMRHLILRNVIFVAIAGGVIWAAVHRMTRSRDKHKLSKIG